MYIGNFCIMKACVLNGWSIFGGSLIDEERHSRCKAPKAVGGYLLPQYSD